MHFFPLKFLDFDQVFSLAGYFEVCKIPKNFEVKVRRVSGQISRNLSSGEKIYLHRGLNNLIFRTWDGKEVIVNQQKEFMTQDGFVGSFYLDDDHLDMQVILAAIEEPRLIGDTPPCGELTSDYIDSEVPTGVYNAIDKFLKDEK